MSASEFGRSAHQFGAVGKVPMTLQHCQMVFRQLMPYSIRFSLLSAGLIGGLACSGRSQTPPPAPPASAGRAATAEPATSPAADVTSLAPAVKPDTSWLKSDSAAST